jgi:hypothetical protein
MRLVVFVAPARVGAINLKRICRVKLVDAHASAITTARATRKIDARVKFPLAFTRGAVGVWEIHLHQGATTTLPYQRAARSFNVSGKARKVVLTVLDWVVPASLLEKLRGHVDKCATVRGWGGTGGEAVVVVVVTHHWRSWMQMMQQLEER